MIITCWGARGSLPVSGKEYVRYGGDTTCMEIRTTQGEIIIVDAGTGIRRLGNKLMQEKRHEAHFIFTHAHWDHILGFPFFKPIYSAETHLQMHGCPMAQNSIEKMLAWTMQPPTFPVRFEEIKAGIVYHEECGNPFHIGSVKVNAIPLSHPNGGLGFKFTEGNSKFVFLTDNELSYKHPGGLDYANYLEFCSEATLLIHDAEFTHEEYRRTRTWGHSTYQEALKLATEAGVEKFGLFHHNVERTDNDVDEIIEVCRTILERKNKAHMECFALHQGWEIEL